MQLLENVWETVECQILTTASLDAVILQMFASFCIQAVAKFLRVTSTPVKIVDFGETTIGDDGAKAWWMGDGLGGFRHFHRWLDELILDVMERQWK